MKFKFAKIKLTTNINFKKGFKDHSIMSEEVFFKSFHPALKDYLTIPRHTIVSEKRSIVYKLKYSLTRL